MSGVATQASHDLSKTRDKETSKQGSARRSCDDALLVRTSQHRVESHSAVRATRGVEICPVFLCTLTHVVTHRLVCQS